MKLISQTFEADAGTLVTMGVSIAGLAELARGTVAVSGRLISQSEEARLRRDPVPAPKKMHIGKTAL